MRLITLTAALTLLGACTAKDDDDDDDWASPDWSGSESGASSNDSGAAPDGGTGGPDEEGGGATDAGDTTGSESSTTGMADGLSDDDGGMADGFADEDSGESEDDSPDSGDSFSICDDEVSISGIDGCVADVLRCDRTVLHTTKAGTSLYSSSDYSAWGCDDVPADRYARPERVYSFAHPGDGRTVTVELSAPCGELDLFVIPWSEWTPGDSPGEAPVGECPRTTSSVSDCVYRHRTGDDGHMINADTPTQFLIIVDGPAGPPINYELATSCSGGGGGSGGGGSGGGTG